MPLNPFSSRYFSSMVSWSLARLAWISVLQLKLPVQQGLQVHATTPGFLCWDGVSLTICLGGPWTLILPTSISWRDCIPEPPHPDSHSF
jgi:hypothetical protein